MYCTSVDVCPSVAFTWGRDGIFNDAASVQLMEQWWDYTKRGKPEGLEKELLSLLLVRHKSHKSCRWDINLLQILIWSQCGLALHKSRNQFSLYQAVLSINHIENFPYELNNFLGLSRTRFRSNSLF
jgi:hypothetical protein